MNENQRAEFEAGWCRRVIADRVWLLHRPTLSVSRPTMYFDGESEVNVFEGEHGKVFVPVLQMENGSAFLANPNAFVELSTHEIVLYRETAEAFSETARAMMRRAAETGCDAEKAIALFAAILRGQLRALGTSSPEGAA